MENNHNAAGIRDALCCLQITNSIPEDKYSTVSRLFHIRKKEYPADAAIFMSGSYAVVFGALISGRVQSVSYDFLGNKKIISEYHALECFAVTNVSSTIGNYPFDYIAAEPSVVLLFDITNIFQCNSPFSAEDRLFAAELIQNESVRQSQRYERHISAMQGKTLRDKLMIFLSDRIREKGSHSFSINFSRQELADYLGVDRSSLCRELSAMKTEGFLKCKGKKFHIFSGHDYES